MGDANKWVVAFISSSEVFVQSPDEWYFSFPLSSTGKNVDESLSGLFCQLCVPVTVPLSHVLLCF